MLKFESTGSFQNTESFLKKMQTQEIYRRVDQIAQRGVTALAAATPKDSAETSASWGYEIENRGSSLSIYWFNTNTVNGTPIAVLLQYGHGTGTGGYVKGYDYINPAIKPVFDQIAQDVWKAVTSA